MHFIKSVILAVFLFTVNLTIGQTAEHKFLTKGAIPEGIYMTLQDVLNRKPTSTAEVFFKTAYQHDSINLPEKAFFYFKEKGKRLLYPLAISFKGELYFQTYNKYTNKKDKGYDPDQHSRYCKVSNYGRFLYFEEDMRGLWSKSFLGNLNPATYSIKGKTKGIVLDLDHEELNILRDCEDLNTFLIQHQITEISCKSDAFTIEELRLMIDEINKPYR